MGRKELYQISKIYQRTVNFKCGKTGVEEIACYEENGKYYLRICKCSCHIIAAKSKTTKMYEVWNEKPFTKEFETKEQANNYFKKVNKNGDWRLIK